MVPFKIVEFYGTKYQVIMNNEGAPNSIRILRETGIWEPLTLAEIQTYCRHVYEQSQKDGHVFPGNPYIKLSATSRGFPVGKFKDKLGQDCSIQKSSLATEDAIWLGVDTEECRMHLTQDMVAELLPLLTQFALTGELK